MNNSKVIIWDLDGTLLDSYKGIVASMNEMLDLNGASFNQSNTYAFLKTYSSKELLLEAAEETGKPFEVLQAQFSKLNTEKDSEIQLFPEAKETLQYLREKGIEQFIYTHKGNSAVTVLKELEILDYFTEVVTGEMGFKRKPDPDALNYLINKYQLDKTKTYYVGDRSLDILCGQNAQINTIFFTETTKKNNEATHIITRLDQIKTIF